MRTPLSVKLDHNVSILLGILIIAFWITMIAGQSEPIILFLRGVLGFLLLIVVPGSLILRIMNIAPYAGGENLLYSVGLSTAFLILLSLFINLFYPSIGLTNPLSLENIILNLTIFFVILILLSHLRQGRNQRNFSKFSSFRINFRFLIFMLLPLLSVVGAYLVNFYAINIIMIALLFAISLTPVIMCLKKIPDHLYPVAVLAISLSLQFHKNLITNYIIGCDIQTTLYFANLVKSTQAWSPQLIGDLPLTLLTVIPTFYSALLNINLDWTFKLVYSFLYALTPVCIFYIFKNFSGVMHGFYASIFFAFQFNFIGYGTPGKQPLAELFTALLLLLVTDKHIEKVKKSLFAVLFSLALINSHYGVSLIFILSLIMAYFIFRFKGENEKITILSSTFIPFFFTLFLFWYVYTAEGDVLTRFINVGELMLREAWLLISGSSLPRTGVEILTESNPLLRQVNLIVYLTLTMLMILGMLHMLWDVLWKRKKITELDAIAIPLSMFLLVSFAIPGGFGIDRMYVLTSVVLSGYILSGYRTVMGIFKRSVLNSAFAEQRSHIALTLLLSIFLLFNSGLIYQLVATPINSAVSLNPQSNTSAYTEAEMEGAKWLIIKTEATNRIFCDPNSAIMFKRFYSPSAYSEKILVLKLQVHLSRLQNFLTKNDAIYIRLKAINDAEAEKIEFLGEKQIMQIESCVNKVYENGQCNIYIADGSA
jgi:uncharacterized membrane protein